MFLPRIPRIHTKIGGIRGQIFSVQNSVAKNLCFCEKDLTVSSTNSHENYLNCVKLKSVFHVKHGPSFFLRVSRETFSYF